MEPIIGKRVRLADGREGRVCQEQLAYARIRLDIPRYPARCVDVGWDKFIDGVGDGTPEKPFRVR
ncbi:hypothetical protein ABT264_19280 [Streptomyces virginiae]|uniref:hypothetical protein n=1 Tax=Streptomyces virginiae TaxID=1961 RepID=UPI00331FB548